jgi:DNA modification methylase
MLRSGAKGKMASKKEKIEISYSLKSVHELTANPRNARTHSESQIKKLAKSIKEFGFINPIIHDDKGVILAGHGRLAAAQKLGIEQVPAIDARHLTEQQKRAYMLADNRMALDAGWDEGILKIELSELMGLEDFDMELTGFDLSEIDLLTSSHTQTNEAENEIPPTPVNAVSKLGDTWLLGPHRVRCGDSTNPADVEVLLQGSKPHLMVTDPPYGVEYDADWRNHTGKKGRTGRAIGKVLNDDRSDWTKAWKLFPGDVAYVWNADKFSHIVAASLESCGFKMRNLIVWVKNQMAISRGDYHHKHEPCWYAVRAGSKGHWNGSRKETTVWDIDKPQKSETGHSTQKPVECMRRPILNNSKHGEIVYDPFLGSGTTVIAAETEGRACYGMELNPAYVDVIVKRWQEFTKKTATLEGTGETFGMVSDNRLQEAA